MIAAHGTHVYVSESGVELKYSPLMEALQHSSRIIPLPEISGVSITEPTPVLGGHVLLEGANVRVHFSPGQLAGARELVAQLSAVLAGETIPETGTVSGLSFVAFDVETANGDWGSICQMGAVRFVDGIVAESVSWYVTPPPGIADFDPDNVAIHGITADMVADAPDFPNCLSELVAFVGESPLVAHNAQFDFTAISRAAMACDIPAPQFVFACTLLLARAQELGLENNKLPTVARGLGIDLTKHHDASADAMACGEILTALARRAHYVGNLPEFVYSQGFTLGILDSNRVYPVLRDRSGAGAVLQRKKLGLGAATSTTTPISAENASEVDAVADTGTDTASPRGRAPWSRVATPEEIPDPNPDADPNGVLFGQNVTLTGDFSPYDKGDLWRRIAALGGVVAKNVTKKSTVLVCGPWASKTSKQKRAEELIAKGQAIQIWSEKDLYTALGLDEQPPF